MQLDEVSVYITDDLMLKEAKKLLKKNNQYVSADDFQLSTTIQENYLQMDVMTEEWYIGRKLASRIISLAELEVLFNELND